MTINLAATLRSLISDGLLSRPHYCLAPALPSALPRQQISREPASDVGRLASAGKRRVPGQLGNSWLLKGPTKKKTSKKSTNRGLKSKEWKRKWADNYPDKFKFQLWHVKGRKDQKIRASPELKAGQMLGNPQGLNWHIKHNITSSTGAQSLVLSGELLYYVLLPQFKSQELEANTAQAFWAHSALHRGAVCTQPSLFLYVLSNILREISVKSSGSQPPTRAPAFLPASAPNLRCNETELFNNKQRFPYGGNDSISTL